MGFFCSFEPFFNAFSSLYGLIFSVEELPGTSVIFATKIVPAKHMVRVLGDM